MYQNLVIPSLLVDWMRLCLFIEMLLVCYHQCVLVCKGFFSCKQSVHPPDNNSKEDVRVTHDK